MDVVSMDRPERPRDGRLGQIGPRPVRCVQVGRVGPPLGRWYDLTLTADGP